MDPMGKGIKIQRISLFAPEFTSRLEPFGVLPLCAKKAPCSEFGLQGSQLTWQLTPKSSIPISDSFLEIGKADTGDRGDSTPVLASSWRLEGHMVGRAQDKHWLNQVAEA